MVNYFFDTYALIEITRNNPNYLKFIGEESAKKVFQQFKDAEVDIDDEVLFKAVKFRLAHKKKSLSYADCIGYIFALENKLKFLTGDHAFEGMNSVEFVK